MCAGSKPAITIGRWRRHCSPFAAKTPLKPISFAIELMREVRWKPSGRSRRTEAMASGLEMTRNSRPTIRNRK
jgi:hypothetical protein